MTDKKNQHYIPKFYLRKFSIENNEKQIGVFNIDNKIFIQKGKLKTQGSKNFFYGQDGIIEDHLSEIEGHLATTLKNLIADKKVPNKLSNEHINLLLFIVLTDLRNPVKINLMIDSFEQVRNHIKELDPNANLDNFVPNLTHEDAVQMSLGNLAEVLNEITDLEYKILTNTTNQPFITSDFPIVKYNQYLELKKWIGTKSGYSLDGLQIFIPINSELILVFYDSAIYKVGDKKQKNINITKESDVNSLNILQFVNCFGTIYFNEKANESYLRYLDSMANKFARANSAKSSLSFLYKDGVDTESLIKAGKPNLIVMGSTDVETKLNLSFMRIHSKGKVKKINNSMAQLRKHSQKISEFKKNR